MLKQDIIDAVKNKQFHIYPVDHYEQALEILTGIKAGKELADGSFEKDSLNHQLMKRLCNYTKLRKASKIRIGS